MEVYWNRDHEDLDEAEGPIAEMFRALRDKGFQIYEDDPNSEEPVNGLDLDELYIEGIRQAYGAAFDTIQDCIEALRNPYQETDRILREYGDSPDLEVMLDYAREMRKLDLEEQINFASAMLEYAQLLNEMYIENKREDLEFKIDYLDMFGTEGFDIDPEEGPIWDQITREDILDHFYDNYVDKN